MTFFSMFNTNLDIVELWFLNVQAKMQFTNNPSSYFSNLVISVDEKLLKAIENEKSWGQIYELIILILQNDEQ